MISDAVVKEILRAPAAVADHILRQIDLIKPIVFPVTKPLTTWRVPISILASYPSGVNWMQFTWLPQLTLRMIIW